MKREQNIHATCLVLGDRGVLITGRSGSGKTSLALALIARYGGMNFARLVSDDRIFVSQHSGRLVGRAPASISGLAEAYGLGPAHISAEAEAVIDLVVDLATPEQAPRFNDAATLVLAGCTLPLLTVAECNTGGAIIALAARLRLPPFGAHEP